VRPFHFAAERLIDAPAAVVYHCLSDYVAHHRHQPEGFLPSAFTRLDVLEGGVGAGTLIRFTTRVGGKSATRTQRVSEPEPGRVLVESGNGEGSTFTVEPRGQGRAWVRIETVLLTSGIEGWLMHIVGPRIMRGLYADELTRLARHAQSHARSAAERSAA
jgi:Polyketide cyclase / dehydrase and lipid transport